MDLTSHQPKIFSVTDVNSIARELLENTMLPMWLNGEVGTLVVARSGHVYMTLKDARSQIRAVWFGGAKMLANQPLKIGDAVEVFGQLSVYVQGGEFQFKVQQLRPVGLGALQRRFEEIKARLQSEGFFEKERKKILPKLPRKIGVITSPDGAALHDFLNVITRRFPLIHIQVYPAQVQGKEAHLQLIQGLRFFAQQPPESQVDLVVLTRGGGSMEDLWCFNDETLARTIAEMPMPVVSAVGHEIDFTIADFVADLRAPTPSAAAELIVPEYAQMMNDLNQNTRQLKTQLVLALKHQEAALQHLVARLNRYRPEALLRDYEQRIDRAELIMQRYLREVMTTSQHQISTIHDKMCTALRQNTVQMAHRLQLLDERLRSLNPQLVLARGYAMIKDDRGNVITSVKKLRKAELLHAHLSDGTLDVSIQNINPKTGVNV